MLAADDVIELRRFFATLVAELVQNWARPGGGTLVQLLLAAAPIMPPVT
jgi:hypothetical protein